MKTNSPCAVCGLPVCWKCHGHRFGSKTEAIVKSDNAHGEKKQPCMCPTGREKRRY